MYVVDRAAWEKTTGDATRLRESKNKRTTMLQFVVFDGLMWGGDDTVMKRPYAERLELLQKNVHSESAAVIVIPDGNKRVRTARELEEILKKTVGDGHEGCMLKDPMATYKCKRVRCVQKVKPRGPDINVCVVGLGFSISNNPRRWGILTGLRWDSSAEKQITTYCRTEVIEGDRLHLAFQHIHRDLASRLTVAAIISHTKYDMQKHKIQCRDETRYNAFATRLIGGELKVEWQDRRNISLVCTLLVMTDALVDVQWLVNPYEVSFSLSLRGDLRPIEYPLFTSENYYFSNNNNQPHPINADEDNNHNNNDIIPPTVGVPRHPVARLEFDPREHDWDCIKSTNRKFAEGQNVATCIETWTLRKIIGLRALPPNRQRMEELGRILVAWMGNLDEIWPQTPPGSIFSIDSLSVALEKAMAHKIAHLVEEEKLIQTALRPLSLDERKAMTGLPSYSQWKHLHHRQKNNSNNNNNNNGLMMMMQMEDEAYDDAEATGEDHRERLKWLKEHIVKTVPMRRRTFADLGDINDDDDDDDILNTITTDMPYRNNNNCSNLYNNNNNGDFSGSDTNNNNSNDDDELAGDAELSNNYDSSDE